MVDVPDTPENRARASAVASRLVGVDGQAQDLLVLASQFLRSEERTLKCRDDLKAWALAKGYTTVSQGTMQDVLTELQGLIPHA